MVTEPSHFTRCWKIIWKSPAAAKIIHKMVKKYDWAGTWSHNILLMVKRGTTFINLLSLTCGMDSWSKFIDFFLVLKTVGFSVSSLSWADSKERDGFILRTRAEMELMFELMTTVRSFYTKCIHWFLFQTLLIQWNLLFLLKVKPIKNVEGKSAKHCTWNTADLICDLQS